jgi:hypothetical protein
MLTLGLNGYSQSFWEWTDPIPITDSVSDNSNAFLYYDGHWGSESVYMVWENSSDSLSTSILFKDLLQSGEEIAILSDSAIHYKNPKIIYGEYGTSDSIFYLLYETDQNGNADIYILAYLSNGTFSDPTPLINTAFNETELAVVTKSEWWDQSVYVANSIAYIRNDSLFTMNLLKDGNIIFWSEEGFIDAPNCTNPIFNESNYLKELWYLKSNGIENHIYNASCDSYGIWQAPEVAYDSTDCQNLDHILHSNDFIWSTFIDSSWFIMNTDWDGNVFTYSLYDSIPLDPAAVTMALGVDATFEMSWIATTYPDSNINEIFMSGPGGNTFLNFSKLGTNNRNPNTFTGEHDGSGYYCWYDYLVWESFRNGHWQIWAAKVLQCAGSVEEDEAQNAFISVYPNPFSNETTIEFTLNTRSNIKLEIYNSQGGHISTLTSQTFNPGTHQLRWNGEGLAAGVYIINMLVGEKIYMAKLLKN